MTELTENFFQDQKEWSRRKLEIIRKYLDGFSKILGNVYYVDGFAGAGKYEDGANGSPIQAAELAEKYRDEKKTYRLYCINVEEDAERFRNLENETKRFGTLVQNLPGSFAGNIDQILSRIYSSSALFFVDPFGVKGTEWRVMEKIINRKEPTDLWIRFDHVTVRRLCGFFESDSRGAQAKISALCKLFGICDIEELRQRLSGNTPEERIQNAIGLYVEQLEKAFISSKGEGFSASIPIYTLDGQSKYHLVFAAAHPRAAILASETAYSVEWKRFQEAEEYRERKTGQLSIFSEKFTENEIADDKAAQLKEIIWKTCAGKKVSRDKLYMSIISYNQKGWFGKFSGSHLNRAITEMGEGINPKIMKRTGPVSSSNTELTFRIA